MTRRLFLRVPLPAPRHGDWLRLEDGRVGTVDTVKIAEDLRDAKITVLVANVTACAFPG